MQRLGWLLLVVAGNWAGCSKPHWPAQSSVALPDSMVSSGVLLANRGDSEFVLKPRWQLRGSEAAPPDGVTWTVSDWRARHQITYRGFDTSVIRISDNRLLPIAEGRSRLIVGHVDITDTVVVIVERVGLRLVPTFDSIGLPRPPSYHVNTWDTVGGWTRHQLLAKITSGMPRSSVIALLGKPRVSCVTLPAGTLTDSWSITTSTELLVASRSGVVSEAHVVDRDDASQPEERSARDTFGAGD
jgi:hypothetical protein